MLARKIADATAFVRQCLALLADEKQIFTIFLVLSVIGALTEGLTVTLLVPILDTQSGVGSFSNVFFLGSVSDLFSRFSPSARIEAVAVAMAALVVLHNLLQYFVDLLGVLVPIRLEQKLSKRSYAALMGVEIAYINEHEYGALLNGIRGFSFRAGNLLTQVATIMWNLLIITIYVVLMLSVSWRLTGFALLFLMIASFLLKGLFAGRARRVGERYSVVESRLNQVIMESMTGMKVVRLSAAEPQMTRTFGRAIEDFNAVQRRLAQITMLTGPLLSTTAGLFICALLFGSAIVHEGQPATWVSGLLMFLFLLFRLLGPVTSINTARTRIASQVHAFDQLHAFYRATEERRQRSGDKPVPKLRQGIAFDGVGFDYKTPERPVLRDVSFTIECGQFIAIVGPSGAGKTTLIALLARLYDPRHGRILVDGTDLRELDLRAWRKRLAVVAQDVFIFNDTVANNIAFGHADVPFERIRAAAKLAAADGFIEELPQGYKSVLGDRGVRLSGGQQQRIAIARAVLADPDLLILDEATSHLDTFTERAIQDAVETISAGRTVLVIAHRLSTIRKADRVLVMDEGRIVEEGSHDELLARRGLYWEMVKHQRIDLVKEDFEDAAEARP